MTIAPAVKGMNTATMNGMNARLSSPQIMAGVMKVQDRAKVRTKNDRTGRPAMRMRSLSVVTEGSRAGDAGTSEASRRVATGNYAPCASRNGLVEKRPGAVGIELEPATAEAKHPRLSVV